MRRFLYLLARPMGDANAVRRGTVGKRIARRALSAEKRYHPDTKLSFSARGSITMQHISILSLEIMLLSLWLMFPANAQMYCSRPNKPYCIDSFGTFDDEWSFDNCRRDMEQYLREIDYYVDCLIMEQDDAITEANRTVDRFNCKAEGSLFCP